jgi:hypothetical protein
MASIKQQTMHLLALTSSLCFSQSILYARLKESSVLVLPNFSKGFLEFTWFNASSSIFSTHRNKQCCCPCWWGEAMSLNCSHRQATIHPRIIWVWRAMVGWYWQGNTKELKRKTCPSASLSTTNPTWTDPQFYDERSATNRMSHGMAKKRCY